MIIASTKPLMISMGFNGYQWAYRRNIETQKAYARRHGYDFVMVEKPAFTSLMMECAWLKIPLLLAALGAGRPFVLYIDCDIEVKNGTPAIETEFADSKTLYMANGFSGRLNSGVILARNDAETISLFKTILDHALMVLPEEDNVGWGENGHVIHFAKNFPGLKLLDSRWNNNRDPEMTDYFRHYSAGPMRKHYRFTAIEKIMLKIGKLYIKTVKLTGGKVDERGFFARLAALTAIVERHYPAVAARN